MALFNYQSPMPGLFWELYDRTIAPAVIETLDADLHHGLVAAAASDSHLLDVGSGGGQHAVRIAREQPGMRVTGIDVAPVMVRRSQELAKRAGVADRVSFQEGDALNLPYADGSFEHVYCAGPLKQVTDPQRVLHECVRVLRPGGRLLVMEVDRGARYDDIEDMCRRSTLPGPWFKRMLKLYFSTYVVSQSLDVEEVRALWAPLELLDTDGPRRVVGHPALIALGTKPAA